MDDEENSQLSSDSGLSEEESGDEGDDNAENAPSNSISAEQLLLDTALYEACRRGDLEQVTNLVEHHGSAFELRIRSLYVHGYLKGLFFFSFLFFYFFFFFFFSPFTGPGADVNCVVQPPFQAGEEFPHTPLLVAAANGHESVVRYLFSNPKLNKAVASSVRVPLSFLLFLCFREHIVMCWGSLFV
jgi:hypothetical protein